MEESKSLKGSDHGSNLEDSVPNAGLKYLNKQSIDDLQEENSYDLFGQNEVKKDSYE